MAYDLINKGMFDKIRLMPDTHVGVGCAIGFTAPLKDNLNPQIVGVDIGCGMTVAELGTIDQLDLPKLDKFIKENIGHGSGLDAREHILTNLELQTKHGNIDQVKQLLSKVKMPIYNFKG